MAWQGLLIYRAYVSFNRVPFAINSMLGLILILIDWVLIEALVQYFAKSEQIGLLVNGFKENICWYGVLYDVLTGIGQFIFQASTWSMMVGDSELFYNLPEPAQTADTLMASLNSRLHPNVTASRGWIMF